MSAAKKHDIDAKNAGQGAVDGEVMTKFGEYDLVALEIPIMARPRVGGNHTGKHGYTIRSSTAVPRFKPVYIVYIIFSSINIYQSFLFVYSGKNNAGVCTF